MNKLLLTIVIGLAAVPLQIVVAHTPDQAPHQIAELGEFQLQAAALSTTCACPTSRTAR